MPAATPAAPTVLTPPALLAHWQGHRRVTRRVIVAFPEDKINSFALGGMRTFGALTQELLSMAVPTMVGLTTGEWVANWEAPTESKAQLLARWDRQTDEIDALWARMRPDAWQETMNAFGFLEGKAIEILLYAIDNEVHHRGQGYVYLRALGIEPPQFPDRS